MVLGYQGCKRYSNNVNRSGATPVGSSSALSTSGCDGYPALLMDSSGEIGDTNATYAEGNGTAWLIFAYYVRFLAYWKGG